MPPFTHALVAGAALCVASATTSAAAAPDNVAPAPWAAGLRLEQQDETLRVLDAQGRVVVGGLDGFFPNPRYALLKRGSQWGVLRADGRVLLAPTYARVDVLTDHALFEVCRDDNDRCGLVDLEGRSVVPMDNERISGPERKQTPWIITKHGRSGAFDPDTRRWVVPQQHAELRVGAGMVLVPATPDGMWQVLDRHGAPVPGVPTAVDWQLWQEGLRVVGALGMFDAAGKAWVPAGRYDAIEPQGETAVVHTGTGQGLITALGREVLAPRFLRVEPLQSEYQGWKRFVEGERWDVRRVGVVDAQGSVVLPAQWDGITLDLADTPQGTRTARIFQVERADRLGVLDAAGNTVFPPRFDSVNMLDYGSVMYRVSEQGKHGLCNFVTGQCPIPVQFDRIEQVDDSAPAQSLFLVSQGARTGLYAEQGQVVVSLRPGEMALSSPSDDPDALQVTVTEDSHTTSLRLLLVSGAWQVQPAGGQHSAL